MEARAARRPVALARAQAELGLHPDGPLDAAAVTAAAVVCFGAGWS